MVISIQDPRNSIGKVHEFFHSEAAFRVLAADCTKLTLGQSDRPTPWPVALTQAIAQLMAAFPVITILGGPLQSGVYVLGLEATSALRLGLGRFRNGQPLDFPAGPYLYIGSALAGRGATSLGPRLLRHATRTGDQPAHQLRSELVAALTAAGLGPVPLRLPAHKRAFWHIDYLLDQPTVALTSVIALRTAQPLEAAIAQLLQADPHTFLIAPGIGACDQPGATHLLGLCAGPAWWAALAQRLEPLVAARPFSQNQLCSGYA
jgi:Uri superfamily endonuclease